LKRSNLRLPDLSADVLADKFGQLFPDVVKGWREVAEARWIQEGERMPEVDLCREVGCRLRFCHPGYILVPASLRDEAIFCSVVFHARGDFDSPGFAGRMPHGLAFADGRAAVVEKVGRPADDETSIKDGGVALGYRGDCVGWMWHLKEYSLHVLRVVDTDLDHVVRVTWIHRASRARKASFAR